MKKSRRGTYVLQLQERSARDRIADISNDRREELARKQRATGNDTTATGIYLMQQANTQQQGTCTLRESNGIHK